MAPNKKKKKPVSNPARGFATTSIASKPKVHNNAVENEPILLHGDFPSPEVESPQSKTDNVLSQSSKASGKELHELTPEELESQLEESDLQLLLEKNGEKSRKDAFRQVSKLQIERRTLRSQAQHLNAHAWLPPELMQQIVDLLRLQMSDGNANTEPEQRSSVPAFSEDDLVIKLWTLEQVLLQLGFTQARTHFATCQLLNKGHPSNSLKLNAGKDFIWGLEDCLDWLILICEPEEMPSYDDLGRKDYNKQLEAVPSSGLLTGEATQNSTSTQPRSSTPLQLPESYEDTELAGHAFQNSPTNTDTESDDNIQPEKLVESYVILQTRLYRLQPDIFELRNQKRKNFEYMTKNNRPQIKHPNTKVARILRKMNDIDADILFDRKEADRKWGSIQNDLAREVAERKKLNLGNGISSAGVSNDHDSPESNPHSDAASISAISEEDPMGMVGELFSTIPESTTDSKTGATSMTSTNQDGTVTIVRDFGTWTGLNPRRIFEEACKARDSLCKVTYNAISSSSFSYRQSVFIAWSRSQDLPINSPLLSVSCMADQRSIKIEMISISTATSIQAEAYVSTVALFLVFSSIPKEEKAYLRLPSAWRDLWTELSITKKDQNDAANREILRAFRSIVIRNQHRVRNHTVLQVEGDNVEKLSKESDDSQAFTSITQDPGDLSDDLKAIWLSKASAPSYNRMLKSRKNLPIWNFKDDILDTVERHQVVIVCGETGCGKSTQIPAFILEHELLRGRPCKVYCTEPRRISAISLARRVSEELGESRNDVGSLRSLVGYSIRLESHVTTQTRLVYATTGIVMRMLERSDDLGNITHLVLDEVHERSIDSDFLLIVLRKLMIRRPTLKVILMSATVDAQRYSNYLNGAPIMTVPGRTFPVETKYLEDAIEVTNFDDRDVSSRGPQTEEMDDKDEVSIEAAAKPTSTEYLQHYSVKTRTTLAKLDEYRIEYDLILKLLITIATSTAYASYSRAILIFLPGIAEIKRLNDMILGHRTFSQRWRVYPLHSTIAMEEQEQAFLAPPQGTRKIVLATNIAETGITIPDVTCVIDTGRHKEMRFDERRQLSRLIESFISRSNAKQRRGRAGRVQNGLCFHMFTKARHDSIMAEDQTPEMLRLSLQDLVLRVKICKLGGIEQTLSEALDPPSSKNIRRAIDSLVDVKALTAAEDLTPLGRQLARLPLDVFLGKLILVGSIFRTLDAALTIAAILSSKSPFSAPIGARSQADVARLAYKKGDSDLLTVYNAYCAWRRVCGTNPSSEQQFCRKNLLSQQTLSNIEDLKAQLTVSLDDAGFLMLGGGEKASLHNVRTHSKWRRFVELPELFDRNNNNDLILNSVITWSFYPKLLQRDGKGWRNVANNQIVSLHPTSVNKGVERPPAWLSFYHIMQSSNKFYNAHETTSAEGFAIALVCGDADFKMYSGVIVIDGNRIRFRADDWKTMLAIKALRTNLRLILSQSFRTPGRQLSELEQAWFDIWQKIFQQDFKDKR